MLEILLDDPEGKEFLCCAISKIINGELNPSSPVLISRLIAISKPDGGVRPVAVGETLYKLAASYVISSLKEPLAEIFGDIQFAYGTPGGCERIVQMVQSLVEQNKNVPDYCIATGDISNAFNSINRAACFNEILKHNSLGELTRIVHFAYSAPSMLHILDSSLATQTIWSECGVRQGDVLGMILFCLGFHPIIKDVASANRIRIFAYADDPTFAGKASDVLPAIDMLEDECRKKLDLKLNKRKSKIYFPAANSIEDISPDLRARLEKAGIEIKIGFIEILGAVVGTDYKAMSAWVDTKVSQKTTKLRASLTDEKDQFVLPLQHTYALLKNCFSQQINFLCRCIPPPVMAAGAQRWDDCMRSLTSSLCRFDDFADASSFDIANDHLRHSLMILPAKDGFPGLGLPSALVISQTAWLGCLIESLPNLIKLGTAESLFNAHLNFDSSVGSFVQHTLNRLTNEECFKKRELIPPDHVFNSNPLEISAIFHRPRVPKPGEVMKPLKLKLQKAFTDARHARALRVILQMLPHTPASVMSTNNWKRTRAFILAACAKHSSLALKSTQLTIRNRDFAFYLRTRLGFPLIAPSKMPEYCFCGYHLSPITCPFASYHFVSCVNFVGLERYALHNNIAGEYMKYCRQMKVHVSDSPSCFITKPTPENKKGKRPDGLVFFDERKAAFDASATCPIADTYFKSYKEPLHAAKEREKAKCIKHTATCAAQNMDFVPFVAETSFGIGSSAMTLVKKTFKAGRVKVPMLTFLHSLHSTMINSVANMCHAMLLRSTLKPHTSHRYVDPVCDAIAVDPLIIRRELFPDGFRAAPLLPAPPIVVLPPRAAQSHVSNEPREDIKDALPLSDEKLTLSKRAHSVPDSPDAKDLILDILNVSSITLSPTCSTPERFSLSDVMSPTTTAPHVVSTHESSIPPSSSFPPGSLPSLPPLGSPLPSSPSTQSAQTLSKPTPTEHKYSFLQKPRRRERKVSIGNSVEVNPPALNEACTSELEATNFSAPRVDQPSDPPPPPPPPPLRGGRARRKSSRTLAT